MLLCRSAVFNRCNEQVARDYKCYNRVDKDLIKSSAHVKPDTALYDRSELRKDLKEFSNPQRVKIRTYIVLCLVRVDQGYRSK